MQNEMWVRSVKDVCDAKMECDGKKTEKNNCSVYVTAKKIRLNKFEIPFSKVLAIKSTSESTKISGKRTVIKIDFLDSRNLRATVKMMQKKGWFEFSDKEWQMPEILSNQTPRKGSSIQKENEKKLAVAIGKRNKMVKSIDKRLDGIYKMKNAMLKVLKNDIESYLFTYPEFKTDKYAFVEGYIEYKLGKYSEALEIFEELPSRSTDWKIRFYMGECNHNLKNYLEAFLNYQDSAEINESKKNPSHEKLKEDPYYKRLEFAENHYEQGVDEMNLRHYAAAIKQFGQSTDENPHRSNPAHDQLQMARMYLQQQKTRERQKSAVRIKSEYGY